MGVHFIAIARFSRSKEAQNIQFQEKTIERFGITKKKGIDVDERIIWIKFLGPVDFMWICITFRSSITIYREVSQKTAK